MRYGYRCGLYVLIVPVLHLPFPPLTEIIALTTALILDCVHEDSALTKLHFNLDGRNGYFLYEENEANYRRL